MELSDEIIINAPKDQVYAALNDPEVLKQCIPGCEELIKHSDTDLEAKVVLKIGPVKARFSGEVQLDTAGAPDAFSLTGKGNGGAAGHAKGGADVTLTADGPDTTILRYEAKAEIAGKLAQLGSRLIQSTAKKLAGKFFKSFAQVVNEDNVNEDSVNEDTAA
ncbi:carbon monoxide dehydrogenase subunit G [Alphaproteobacteria bacterium KMM 3653]|uniref:Carbon monoxide dehydrogenase subunit G n=1 Tax=Harenicola maris TaxID=2841044 RepID=A0AAP2CNY5_9RHOB|nr:carbon monoxide dehydrogenase subunit G [Harenicola maris]